MSEREGTAEDFARMIAGAGNAEQPAEPEPERNQENPEAAIFAALREKDERNRAFVESLHPRPKENG